jgi:hypothetical protein
MQSGGGADLVDRGASLPDVSGGVLQRFDLEQDVADRGLCRADPAVDPFPRQVRSRLHPRFADPPYVVSTRSTARAISVVDRRQASMSVTPLLALAGGRRAACRLAGRPHAGLAR